MWRSTSASGRSHRVFSRIIWNAQRQLSLSVRCTIPRNSRRLVRTLNSVGEMIVSRWVSLGVWSWRMSSFASFAYASPRWVSNRLSQ